MGFLLNQFREAQLRRGKLPKRRVLTTIPRARAGVFRIGVAVGGGEIVYDPLGDDPPHFMVAGASKGGKTVTMNNMGLQATSWPSADVVVLDPKGTGDYWPIASQGGQVIVDQKPGIELLKETVEEIRKRNRIMWDTPLPRESRVEPGKWVEDRAVHFDQLPDAVKQEHGWKLKVFFIDEIVDLLADKKNGGEAALLAATALARSAGLIFILGSQRFDAKYFDGFIKNNVQARILLGPSDPIAEQMVMGSAVAALADSDRNQPRPPGRGLAIGFGPRPGVTRFQAYKLEPDRYLRYTAAPGAPAAAGGDSEAPAEGEGTDSSDPSALPRTPTEYAGPVRSFLIRPFARLRIRVSAQRLWALPLRDPRGRNSALAYACTREALGVCQSCGVTTDWLEADHRRPLGFGGQDRKENLWALCAGRRLACHDTKTRIEGKVRKWRRRLGMVGRSGYGRVRLPRLPLWVWIGAACFLTGLVTDQWKMWAMLIGGLLAFGPLILQLVLFSSKHGNKIGGFLNYRANKSAAEILQRRASARERETRGTFMDRKARAAADLEYGLATLRLGLIGMSAAYLLGVFGPGLVF